MSTITKTVKYYKVVVNPTIMFHETKKKQLETLTYPIFLKAFPEENYYEHEYDKQKYGIDVLEMTKDYFFASCSVSNNITPTSFMQIRDVETKQRRPFNMDNLEKYTYLLLSFHTNRMVMMSGSGLSKITEVIYDYVNIAHEGLADIEIRPEKVQDFEKNARRFSKINNIEFKVVDDTYNNVGPLNTVLEGSSVESYSINFKLKESGEGILDNLKKMKSHPKIHGIKAYGKNEFDLNDVIDYFATQFTRTIPLNIDDENALNQVFIKNKLMNILDY